VDSYQFFLGTGQKAPPGILSFRQLPCLERLAPSSQVNCINVPLDVDLVTNTINKRALIVISRLILTPCTARCPCIFVSHVLGALQSTDTVLLFFCTFKFRRPWCSCCIAWPQAETGACALQYFIAFFDLSPKTTVSRGSKQPRPPNSVTVQG